MNGGNSTLNLIVLIEGLVGVAGQAVGELRGIIGNPTVDVAKATAEADATYQANIDRAKAIIAAHGG